jgi:glycosyltransferase involved in cell wall biosynthesis
MVKISVIIPLYNKGRHIERTISTVLQQTVSNFEIIVVDDGSTDDGAVKVCQINDTRIRLISQKNKGAAAARNLGILNSQSDFVAFLDADDEWDSDHLNTLLNLRSKFPDAVIYGTAWDYIRLDGKRVAEGYRGIAQAPWEGIIPQYFRCCALGEAPLCSSSTAVLKKVFSEVGYFQEGIVQGEDLDMWGRIAIRYPVAFSWNGKAIYHLDAENRVCLNYSKDKEYPFVISAYDAINNGQVSTEKLNDLHAYICQLQLYTSHSLLMASRRKEARNILKKVQKKKILFLKFYLIYFLTFIPNTLSSKILIFKQKKMNHYINIWKSMFIFKTKNIKDN